MIQTLYTTRASAVSADRMSADNRRCAVKVRNINGTSDTKCRCGSWLDHWVTFSKQSKPSQCPASGCVKRDIVGAHVQKGSGSSDQKWYIYPLCQDHNKHAGELDVSDVYKLVSANKKETCDK